MRRIACAIVIAALAMSRPGYAGLPEHADDDAQPVKAQPNKELELVQRANGPDRDERALSADKSKILSQEVSLDFDNASLRDAFRQLASQAGLNIFVDFPGLKEAGVTLDTKVSIIVDGVSLKSALSEVLEPLGLTFEFKDDVLKIISREAPPEMLTVNYSVAGLVLPANGGLPVGANEKAAAHADLERLMRLISRTIQPESWEELSGPGAIMPYRTTLSLVIRQTSAVHEEIADLLSQLRRPGQLAVRLRVALVTIPGNKLPGFAKADAVNPKLSSVPKNAAVEEGFILRDANARLLLNYAKRRPTARVTHVPPPGLIISDGKTSDLNAVAADVINSAHTTFGFRISAVISADRESMRLTIEPAAGAEGAGIRSNISVGVRHEETIACDVTGLLQVYRESKARANGADTPAQRGTDEAGLKSPDVREFLIITPRILAPLAEEILRDVDLPKR